MPLFPFLSLRLALLPGLLAVAVAVMAQTNPPKVLVLGDSISAAYGMSLEQGWVRKMSQRLAEDDVAAEFVNASISGETSGGALQRLPKLLESHAPEVVIIELGGNDGLRGYPLGKLQQNLAQLVQLSDEAGARTILVPMEIPPNYGRRYALGFRNLYPTVAGETGATLSPFIMDGVATQPALMQEDGIHPTAEAQSLLVDNMMSTIKQALQTP